MFSLPGVSNSTDSDGSSGSDGSSTGNGDGTSTGGDSTGSDGTGNNGSTGSNNNGSTGNSTSSSNSTKVYDITNKIKSDNSSKVLNYTTTALANNPYNLTSGYEFALLVDPDATTMIVSCSNGNMYAFSVDSDDNQYCSEMWATKEDILVMDASARVMHYYNNTMSAVGVSRLRVEDETDIPSSGVVVAWAPYSDDGSDDYWDDYLYLAVDPQDQIFYPVVCTYEDNSLGAKMFLAQDPEEGVEMLKSEDLRYTVTGGVVKECYAMKLMQGMWAEEGDSYSDYGNTDDWDEWDLEDDWYDDDSDE